MAMRCKVGAWFHRVQETIAGLKFANMQIEILSLSRRYLRLTGNGVQHGTVDDTQLAHNTSF